MKSFPSSYIKWILDISLKESQNFEYNINLYDDFKDTGRGLKAIKDISKNDLLVEIPLSIILSSLNIRYSPLFNTIPHKYFPSWAFTGIIPDKLDNIDIYLYENSLEYQVLNNPFISTIFLLMYEKYNPNSYWKEMISLMPLLDDHIFFWTNEDYNFLTNSSILPENIRKQMKTYRKCYFECFLPLFQRYPTLFPPGNYSYDDFKWCIASIWSRGYMLDSNDIFPGLIPLADMFNHDITPNNKFVTNYYLDINSKTFKIFSKVSYKEGEQVFSSYGNKSNDEWLIDYGFIFPNNLSNAIRLKIPILKETDDFYNEKKNILDTKTTIYISTTNESIDFMYLRIYFMDNIDYSRTINNETLQEIFDNKQFNIGISFRNEYMVFNYIIEYLYTIKLSKEERDKLEIKYQNLCNISLNNITNHQKNHIKCLLFIIEEQKTIDILLEYYIPLYEKLIIGKKEEEDLYKN